MKRDLLLVMDDPLLNGLSAHDLSTTTDKRPLPYMPRRNLVFFSFPLKKIKSPTHFSTKQTDLRVSMNEISSS
uniref:Putative ovule protein n=1 Tax=Solanum chacoense TaxID=4108 RepID=A0A0V0GND5_SOLCH